MQVRFLMGPAGSGKTFRCLREIREQLSRAVEGVPVVLVAPKQTTYGIERQLLADASIEGYTRLHILSFERLADFVFRTLGAPPPELLSEAGRIMVLRGLLARKRGELQLFRASSRLTGFAQQLSSAIAEFQSSRLTPDLLRQLAQGIGNGTLALKLQDLAALMQDYLDWLAAHQLQDRDCLLTAATEALLARGSPKDSLKQAPSAFQLDLYIDGFAEFSETEIELVAALLPNCRQATITFCLPEDSTQAESWLSDWSVARRALDHCRKRLATVPGAELSFQQLPRDPQTSRFKGSRVLRHLERHWTDGEAYGGSLREEIPGETGKLATRQSLRIVECPEPEAEVILAAREILAFVRRGGRYREAAVLVRDLESYHQVFQRVFSRYEIPFFLDRREPVGHHPVAELTRSALRTGALGWQHEDWFAVLKTGLVRATDEEIDRLENEALARGWQGSAWQRPLRILAAGTDEQDKQRLFDLEADLERLRQRLIPPFQKLVLAIKQAQNKPTGIQLGSAIRDFWAKLQVPQQLERWALMPAPGLTQETAGALHETVWKEINGWLENIELAFANDAIPIREWLPILEAGLANLAVGLIPPALDQVLIGTIDRSRNPDIKLGLVLGMNESVFPAPPAPAVLLAESERAELERHNVNLGLNCREQLSRERYYAYLACTRPREQLLVTCATRDTAGAVLNPSPFLRKLRELFPSLEVESAPPRLEWHDCQHPHELFGALFQQNNWSVPNLAGRAQEEGRRPVRSVWSGSAPPWAGNMLRCLAAFPVESSDRPLTPGLAEQLYGRVLHTSVSRMEQFAACPFKFFVHSGLRAEERKLFELDVRERGSFQHDVLALFHEQLRRENKRWRDITPVEARGRVAAVAASLIEGYREGLLQATEQTKFMARAMTESLQDFVEVLVGWMREQYEFDPVRVELPFGDNEAQPAWTLDLAEGHQLQMYGRIDRVDLYRRPGTDEALCVVVDYKSSPKQLDPVLMAHGLQLQLLTYLDVLRDWPNPVELFGVRRLLPAGVFYVNLSGKHSSEKNRADALDASGEGRKLAYRHAGRFDAEALRLLDRRADAKKGDQFNYRVSADGKVYKSCREPMAPGEFIALLDSVKACLLDMGRRIYSGAAMLDPYRKGAAAACDQCPYQWICRIDPWTHRYRVLGEKTSEEL